jgi:hypothetical protein
LKKGEDLGIPICWAVVCTVNTPIAEYSCPQAISNTNRAMSSRKLLAKKRIENC